LVNSYNDMVRCTTRRSPSNIARHPSAIVKPDYSLTAWVGSSPFTSDLRNVPACSSKKSHLASPILCTSIFSRHVMKAVAICWIPCLASTCPELVLHRRSGVQRCFDTAARDRARYRQWPPTFRASLTLQQISRDSAVHTVLLRRSAPDPQVVGPGDRTACGRVQHCRHHLPVLNRQSHQRIAAALHIDCPSARCSAAFCRTQAAAVLSDCVVGYAAGASHHAKAAMQ
jgi:hypothetical protein